MTLVCGEGPRSVPGRAWTATTLVPQRGDGAGARPGEEGPRPLGARRAGAVPAPSADKGTAGARSAPAAAEPLPPARGSRLPGPRRRAPKTHLDFQQTRPGETAARGARSQAPRAEGSGDVFCPPRPKAAA